MAHTLAQIIELNSLNSIYRYQDGFSVVTCSCGWQGTPAALGARREAEFAAHCAQATVAEVLIPVLSAFVDDKPDSDTAFEDLKKAIREALRALTEMCKPSNPPRY